jgi:hypothetical protein
MRILKTLTDWFGFDPIEPRRHPEIPMTPLRTLFESEVNKQHRRTTAIDRDRDVNAKNLGRIE